VRPAVDPVHHDAVAAALTAVDTVAAPAGGFDPVAAGSAEEPVAAVAAEQEVLDRERAGIGTARGAPAWVRLRAGGHQRARTAARRHARIAVVPTS
jgi:hypothetical protein